MSGIVGSRFNTRGSGLVGSLGTDGQILTSSGAGVGAVFETAAGGAAIKSITQTDGPTSRQSFSNTSFAAPSTALEVTITPQSADSKFLIICGTGNTRAYGTIYRDSTNLGDASAGLADAGDAWNSTCVIYLDSPATTSEIVYSYQIKRDSGTGYINNSSQHHHMQCIEIDVS